MSKAEDAFTSLGFSASTEKPFREVARACEAAGQAASGTTKFTCTPDFDAETVLVVLKRGGMVGGARPG